MNKIFYLGTCSTCARILGECGTEGFTLHDIKVKNISAAELDALAAAVGSYNALFSRRAIKYKEMGLAKRELSESEIRELILSEYTFLKRPVYVKGKAVVAGNDKKAVAQMAALAAR